MTTKSNDHDEKGKFKKGNTAARKKKRKPSKSLVKYIVDNTKDGQLLADKLIDIIKSKRAKPKDVMDATKILLERGWGKSAQPVDANVQGDITFKWEGEDESDNNNTVQTPPVAEEDTSKS